MPVDGRKQKLQPERILVVKAAGIGDLILAVPALRALRSRFPKAKIDLLVTPKCSSVLKNCPYLDDIYVIQTHGARNEISVSDVWTVFRRLYELRRKKYDLLINLFHLFTDSGAARMRLLNKVIGARSTLGRNTDGRGTFYDKWIYDSWEDPSLSRKHEVDVNLDVVRCLGAEDPGEGLEFWVRNQHRSRMQAILAGEGVLKKTRRRLVLNPGGDAFYKRWPEEHFAALADLFMDRMNAEVMILGAAADKPGVDRILSMMEHRPVNLVGKLNLLEAAAFLETCDLMVTNDTGPMHLAAALKTPVVAFFGPGRPGNPGEPGRYLPYGPVGFHTILCRPVVCDTCTTTACEDRECLRKILPEEVFRRVAERLATRQEVCS